MRCGYQQRSLVLNLCSLVQSSILRPRIDCYHKPSSHKVWHCRLHLSIMGISCCWMPAKFITSSSLTHIIQTSMQTKHRSSIKSCLGLGNSTLPQFQIFSVVLRCPKVVLFEGSSPACRPWIMKNFIVTWKSQSPSWIHLQIIFTIKARCSINRNRITADHDALWFQNAILLVFCRAILWSCTFGLVDPKYVICLLSYPFTVRKHLIDSLHSACYYL